MKSMLERNCHFGGWEDENEGRVLDDTIGADGVVYTLCGKVLSATENARAIIDQKGQLKAAQQYGCVHNG